MPTAQQVPDWVRNAIFYQTFPERFANGDPGNDPPSTQAWGGTPTRILAAETNHRYDCVDYERVDPYLGDLDTFRRLVTAAHERGIRVVLDAVCNHCGKGHWAFQGVIARGTESPYVILCGGSAGSGRPGCRRVAAINVGDEDHALPSEIVDPSLRPIFGSANVDEADQTTIRARDVLILAVRSPPRSRDENQFAVYAALGEQIVGMAHLGQRQPPRDHGMNHKGRMSRAVPCVSARTPVSRLPLTTVDAGAVRATAQR